MIAGRVSRIAVTTLAAAACVLGSVSCSAPSKGALVLAISTDMQTPKDIDVVSVFVSTNSVPKYDYLGRVTPDGKVTLPATMPVVEPDDPSAKVRIRVVAFKQADAKVMRDVVTTVPHQRTALLRLPLDFLDVGSVKSGGIPPKFFPDGKSVVDGLTEWDPTNPTDVVPKCDFLAGLTMVNGVCAEVGVDSSKLPDYSEPAVFGEGGLQNGVPASCFDAARCFAGATPVVGLTTAASGACSFPLPAGAQPSTFNVALVTATTGTCAGASCYVPLPNDADEGWVVSSGTVQLAPGVCQKLGPAPPRACPSRYASPPTSTRRLPTPPRPRHPPAMRRPKPRTRARACRMRRSTGGPTLRMTRPRRQRSTRRSGWSMRRPKAGRRASRSRPSAAARASTRGPARPTAAPAGSPAPAHARSVAAR